ncbi:MAG: MBL fold metallo-hydrolase [Armatimonadota bacterium]
MEITFYGVRGSLPAPATAACVEAQLAAALHQASQAGARFETVEEARRWLTAHVPFHRRATYGGDTTCFLVRCGESRIVVDAGSGIRRLGLDLMPELARTGSLELDVLFTHMHLDHVMGFPFFAPLFAPKRQLSVRLGLHGGAAWQNDLQRVLSATFSPPLFPVDLDKLRSEAASLEYHPVYDGLQVRLGARGDVTAFCRRLNHPNETYGWRIEHEGKVFVVATDTEPFAGPHPALMELAEGADVLYVDAQYDWLQYTGAYDGVSRVGWGHGYAEWCGRYAREAGVRMVVMGHHDPAAGNERVYELGEKLRAEFPNTVVGFDGLQVHVAGRSIEALGAGEGGDAYRVARDARV